MLFKIASFSHKEITGKLSLASVILSDTYFILCLEILKNANLNLKIGFNYFKLNFLFEMKKFVPLVTLLSPKGFIKNNKNIMLCFNNYYLINITNPL